MSASRSPVKTFVIEPISNKVRAFTRASSLEIVRAFAASTVPTIISAPGLPASRSVMAVRMASSVGISQSSGRDGGLTSAVRSEGWPALRVNGNCIPAWLNTPCQASASASHVPE